MPPLPCTANEFGDFRRHGPRIDYQVLGLGRISEPLVAPIVAQDPAAKSLCSYPLGHRFAQDTAAGTPRSIPPGHHLAQDSALERLTALLPATALLKTLPPGRLAAFPLSLIHI